MVSSVTVPLSAEKTVRKRKCYAQKASTVSKAWHLTAMLGTIAPKDQLVRLNSFAVQVITVHKQESTRAKKHHALERVEVEPITLVHLCLTTEQFP